MTFKQKLFIKYYLKNLNATEAVCMVYKVKNRNVAGVIGYQNLRKLQLREEIERLLKDGGLNPEALIENLRVIAMSKPVNVTGETKLKALQELLKLQGSA